MPTCHACKQVHGEPGGCVYAAPNGCICNAPDGCVWRARWVRMARPMGAYGLCWLLKQAQLLFAACTFRHASGILLSLA